MVISCLSQQEHTQKRGARRLRGLMRDYQATKKSNQSLEPIKLAEILMVDSWLAYPKLLYSILQTEFHNKKSWKIEDYDNSRRRKN